jgi:pimeloyl-ACP methyl ester carboxylesterase
VALAVPPPPVEGTVTLSDGRRLGFAEYGDPEGRPVFWFHGTPGARRQVPLEARRVAAERGVRLIAVERPGVGASTPHTYERISEWAADIAEVADRLGVDRFAAVGLSGGGPYVLACAHHLPERMVAGGVLGGVAPTRGPEAIGGGLVQLATWTRNLLRPLREPFGHGLWLLVQALRPFADQVFSAYVRIQPEGDKAVFNTPGMREMFIDDLLHGASRRFRAFVYDAVLFTRHWGFHVADIRVPIHFWHGDADPIVPLEHGRHLAQLVPHAELRVRPGESHLGGLGAAEEVLDTLLAHWDDAGDGSDGGDRCAVDAGGRR